MSGPPPRSSLLEPGGDGGAVSLQSQAKPTTLRGSCSATSTCREMMRTRDPPADGADRPLAPLPCLADGGVSTFLLSGDAVMIEDAPNRTPGAGGFACLCGA